MSTRIRRQCVFFGLRAGGGAVPPCLGCAWPGPGLALVLGCRNVGKRWKGQGSRVGIYYL